MFCSRFSVSIFILEKVCTEVTQFFLEQPDKILLQLSWILCYQPPYPEFSLGLTLHPKKSNEATKTLEHKSYDKQLRELQLFILEKRRLKADHNTG